MIYFTTLRNTLLIIFILAYFDITAQQDEYVIATLKEHSGQVYSIAFSPDGKQFISGSKDESIIIWDFETLAPLKTLKRHYATVYELEYSNNGKLFFSGGDKTINVWEKDGTYVKSLSGHTTAVWSMGISSDANYVVSGSFDHEFRLWDVETGETVHIFEKNRKSILAVAFSEATNLIASGSQNGYIDIFTFDNYELIHTFPAHSGNIYSLAFSGNGRYLASASREGTIKIWDITKMEIVHVLTDHERSVMSVNFSHNNRFLVSGSYDATLKLWDVDKGEEIYTFVGHKLPVNDVDISKDNNYILSASTDHTIKLWELKPEILVNYYFEDEFNSELNKSDLFAPKKSSESRTEYKERQKKAEEFKQQLMKKFINRL